MYRTPCADPNHIPTNADVVDVQRAHPDLHYYGYGPTTDSRSYAWDYDLIHLVADWLKANFRAARGCIHNSYTLKHVVERELGEYVSNGTLICAGLLVGFPMEDIDESPNTRFYIRQIGDSK